MTNNNFVVFITSHQRSDNVATYRALRRHGYTGKIKIVIDDEDKQLTEYQKQFGDELIIFNKLDMLARCETIDNFNILTSVLYPRNFVIEYANANNIEYFATMDDDIDGFYYRFPKKGKLKTKAVTQFDEVIKIYVDFLKKEQISMVALAGPMEYIGGVNGNFKNGYTRMLHQCYIQKNNNIKFIGTRNEDVCACSLHGKVGKVLLELFDIMFMAKTKGQSAGGLADLYAITSEYVWAFYPVICSPNCFKIVEKGGKIIFRVSNNNYVPLIIDERFKK